MWPPEPEQRGIMGGAEQLPLFDSPVSGMVLAPHQGAKQECNRPDQLRQCRDHCYSDLGFLLPVTTSGLRVKMCVWLGVSRGLDLAFLNAD